ncbi:MAG: tRNA-dihydrouridine synthase, partial [Candidatus Eisenbacteria bacterium]|nr:tRNA-dihydrouridine synthase [Candidatus Eisenbacteria bacterium]
MVKIGSLSFDRPPLLLAPMEDVTERPFRRVCRRLGADLVTTEFVSSEALIRQAAKSHGKIRLADDEHPVAIQIYGNREEALVEAARLSEGRPRPDRHQLRLPGQEGRLQGRRRVGPLEGAGTVALAGARGRAGRRSSRY